MVKSQIEKFLCSKEDIVLFGTMNLAQIANKVCLQYKKTVLGFCDNNPNKQGRTICGKPVFSFEELKTQGRNIDICICAFKKESIIAIKNQLAQAGFYNVFTWEPILYLFQCEMKKRELTLDEFNGMAKTFAYPESKLILKNVSLSITERCTLCCRDCGELIPYFMNPKDYDVDTIIASLKELDNCVDVIQSLGIMGGEPFLYPHLLDICEVAVKLKKVRMVAIVTNGTIVPKDAVLQKIAELGIVITISDYEELSVNKKKLCEALDKFDIPYELFESERYWYKCELPLKKNRTLEENIKYYNSCIIAKECPMLQSGKLFVCGWHSSSVALGVYEEENGEFVNLLDGEKDSLQKREQIKELFYEKKVLDVCDYCTLCEAILVGRAVQGERHR